MLYAYSIHARTCILHTRVRARITPGWQVDLATVRVRTLVLTWIGVVTTNSVAPS